MLSDHFVCYSSTGLLRRKRRRDLTKEEGEAFLKRCVESYKKKCGAAPNLALVPDDYLGGDNVIKGVKIERGAKPRGHYLVGYKVRDGE